MRKILMPLLCSVSFLLNDAAAQTNSDKKTSGNPIFPGWYADPEAVIMNKTIWVYPTYSAPFEEQVFMDAFSSTDMVNWQKHVRIIDTNAVRWAKKAMWAPAMIQKGGKYYLFFAANDVHEGEIGGIGVGVSDKPEGPFKDLLGKPLIGTIENGAQPIDQYVFEGNDRHYYMVYGGWGHCNIVRLKPDFTGVMPHEDGTTFKEITPNGYVEGPIIFTRKGKQYFMWSEGGWTGPDYRVAYAMSSSLWGPWTRIGTVLQQDSAVATGAGHHSVVQLPGTDEWYIFYHRRPLGDTNPHHRVTCVERLNFDAEGRIQKVTITTEGVGKVQVKK